MELTQVDAQDVTLAQTKSIDVNMLEKLNSQPLPTPGMHKNFQPDKCWSSDPQVRLTCEQFEKRQKEKH